MLLSRSPEIKRNFTKAPEPQKAELIRLLLANRISHASLENLRKMDITAEDLSDIIQHIYDLNEKYILELSAVEGLLRQLDDIKNRRRNKKFFHKINRPFRKPDEKNRKVILAEGDSWF